MIMKKLLFLTGFLALAAGGASAQPVYSVRDVGMSNVDDSVHIRFVVVPGEKNIMPRGTLILTPVIRGTGQVLPLEPLVYRGRLAEKIHSRNEVFSRRRPSLPDTNSDLEGLTYYHAVVPFRDWMRGGGLVLNSQWYGCKKDMVAEQNTLQAEPVPAPPAPPVVVVVEKPVPAKPLVFEVKKVTGNAYLDFPVGKSAIQPDFRNNAAELAKIRGTLDSLIQAKNVRVRGITLVGYASPEGSTQLNDRLSAERADALKAYLLQNYKKGDPGLISARSGGEDWNGLRSLVAASSIRGKEALLKILDSDASDVAKKASIKALNGGATYATLLKDYYPRLRKVEYTIDYELVQQQPR